MPGHYGDKKKAGSRPVNAGAGPAAMKAATMALLKKKKKK